MTSFIVFIVSAAAALLVRNICCSPCCAGNNSYLNGYTCGDNGLSPMLLEICSKNNSAVIFMYNSDEIFGVTPDGYLNSTLGLVSPKEFCTFQEENGNSTSALVCSEYDDELSTNKWMGVYSICICISAVFLLVTLLVYCILPGLRDLQGKTLMAAIFSLFLAFVWLAVVQINTSEMVSSTCTSNAFLMYFWMLSAFFWVNIVAFNVWRSVMCVLNYSDNRLFACYCLYGWGVPFLFLCAALITDYVPGSHLRPNFGKSRCWFHGPLETWGYFYGPVSVIVATNTMFFLWCCCKLWAAYHGHSTLQLRSLRFKCLLYLKLFLIMGIAWMFEVISFATGSSGIFWIVMDLFNSLQGILIFFVVVCRKRVFRQIQTHKPLGIRFPQDCLRGEDQESETMFAEEAELSRTVNC